MSDVHWVRNCMLLSTFALGATAALAQDASLLGKSVREANDRFTDVATAVPKAMARSHAPAALPVGRWAFTM